MSTPDIQERLKEEAKTLRDRIDKAIKERSRKKRALRTFCVYAGMITETLMEYEEPDVVMEQAFHRVSDLMKTEPSDIFDRASLPAWNVDRDTEMGRVLARSVAEKLPRGLDDAHEIALALIISDFPRWEKEGFEKSMLMRVLVEAVIASLSFEMATQDFCDLLIEEYISDEGMSAADALLGLAAMAGYYYGRTGVRTEKDGIDFTNVMVRESLRYGMPGSKNWELMAASNDLEHRTIPVYMKTLKPQLNEFFEIMGLEDPLGQAVSVAKAVGRMASVTAVEDVGHLHPSVAKSLAKTGMILGLKFREDIHPNE